MKIPHSFIKIALVLSLSHVAAHASLQAHATPCVKLLTKAQIAELLEQDQSARVAFWGAVAEPGGINKGPALRFLRDIESKHPAGPRHVYRLIDPSHPYSEAGYHTGNPEGAYHFALLTLGARVSRLFGIEVNLERQEVTYPSARRIQATIERLNRHLPQGQRILWTFYDEPKKIQGLQYLQRFAQEFGLPISKKFRAHDINYHLGNIGMPNAMAETLKLKVNLQLRYLDQLLPAWERERVSWSMRRAGRRQLERLIAECIRLRVIKLDTFSGNFTSAVAGRLGPQSLEDWSFHYIVTAQQSVTAATQLYESVMLNEVFLSPLPEIAPFKDWIKQNLQEFLLQNHTPENNTVVFIYGQELRDLVTERRIALEQAAIAVEKEMP